MAGVIQPAYIVVSSGSQPPRHRRLLRDLEQSLSSGDLKDSELGPIVLQSLQQARDVDLVPTYDANWISVGIRVADAYFRLIRPSAGERDWQRDFAKTATPILVGVAKSLARSPDAQAVILRLCGELAQRLRLTLVWPPDPDDANDLRNELYRACLRTHEVESDEVLIALQKLTVVGPN